MQCGILGCNPPAGAIAALYSGIVFAGILVIVLITLLLVWLGIRQERKRLGSPEDPPVVASEAPAQAGIALQELTRDGTQAPAKVASLQFCEHLCLSPRPMSEPDARAVYLEGNWAPQKPAYLHDEAEGEVSEFQAVEIV